VSKNAYLDTIGYRQLEGLTRSLGRIFPILPVIDYSWIRRRIVLLGEDLVSYNMRSIDGPVVIVLDSTGVKVCRSGSWLERRYSRRRGYLKIHLAIDARTGEIVYFERTTDRVHDSEAAKRMVDRSMKAGNVIKVIGDGAYDSIRLIRHLERRGIEPIIRPRRNARTDRGPPSRRSAAMMIRDYGYRAWSRIVGHGGRWMAETAISRLKALFGEHPPLQEAEMDGLRADDQGAHTQHAIESRNNLGNWAPAGEGKIEPQELGHKAIVALSLNHGIIKLRSCLSSGRS
jgi:hypothetical protein